MRLFNLDGKQFINLDLIQYVKIENGYGMHPQLLIFLQGLKEPVKVSFPGSWEEEKDLKQLCDRLFSSVDFLDTSKQSWFNLK